MHLDRREVLRRGPLHCAPVNADALLCALQYTSVARHADTAPTRPASDTRVEHILDRARAVSVQDRAAAIEMAAGTSLV